MYERNYSDCLVPGTRLREPLREAAAREPA